MTQCEMIVDYIQRHGKITQLEAIANLGIMRLASRVNELKQCGVDVRSQMVYKTDENGKAVKKWKEYWI